MYADNMTDSMRKAIDETNRRRKIQNEYNTKNNITPKTIIKEIGEVITLTSEDKVENVVLDVETYKQMTPYQKKKVIEQLEKQMKEAAKNLNFEEAMALRDLIFELKAGDK